jgi:cytochrome c biogenesis protein CcdA
MLSSITPLGERSRNNRFVTAASWFIAGSLIGGATTGAVAGGLGQVVVPENAVADGIVIVVVALLGALFDAKVGGLRLPTIARQVDERWLQKYRGWVYGFGFGVQLGTGLATIVSSAAIYLMLVAAVLTRSALAGLAIGVAFGLLRGATLLLGRRVRTPDELRRFHRRLAAGAHRSERVSVAAQGLMSLAGIVAVVAVR